MVADPDARAVAGRRAAELAADPAVRRGRSASVAAALALVAPSTDETGGGEGRS